ncbi:DUF4349 domain-containing protein [Salinibacterium sp. ZJ454]|uniref:DUF4349 domain-containing protein n=1 Tax=Salinibacterium sp. ZJ454 TaxID=2708339 RepID=UPI00141E1E23|nr:DUF4349 domain-containing protein [Salinibacterium sp. ZJ454]
MRRILGTTALLAAVIALAGCTGLAGNDTSTIAPEGTVTDQGGTSSEMAPGAPGAIPDVAESDRDRQVISTGSVTVVADDPIAAASDATEIVESAGGRVDSRFERTPTDGSPGSATLTLRIPADRLTQVLDDLKRLGDAREVSLSTDDVTVVVQDLDARITALSASVDRLLALLSTATDTKTLIELETALSSRQAELESLESQRRYYADQVSLATITLTLLSETEAAPETPNTFWSGLTAGWDALVGFLAGLLVAFGVLLPWLVLVALLAAAVIFVVRRTRAARQNSGTAAPSTDAEG